MHISVDVLSMLALSTADGAYYLSDRARELGPPRAFSAAGASSGLGSSGTASVGRWSGKGASALGLEGAVGDKALATVLTGRSPRTDRSLVGRRGRVTAFDLTFSAPKSVSILFALAPLDVRHEVIEAHTSSVDAVVDYLDRRAISVRRGTGEDRRVLQGGGTIAASFMHGVSRSLDPHLHTHLVVANLTHGADGRWSSIDGRGVFAHRRVMASLYEAELRHHLLISLGTAWERRRNGLSEIQGVDPVAMGAFSGRAAEVRAAASQLGSRSFGARSRARMTTREPKSGDLLHDELLDRWRRTGVDVGIDEHAVAQWLDRGATTNQWLDEHRFAAALSNSDHAAATRRSVVQAWADASASGGRVTAVESSAEWAMAFDASVRALPGDHAEVPGPPGRLLPPAQLLAPGIAEPVQAIGRIVAPRYLLRALGPRPLHHRAQAVWRDAALGIERYRERWAVGDANYALGPDNDLGRMSVSQLADRIRVSQLIERGTRALSHERGRVVERSGPDIGAR